MVVGYGTQKRRDVTGAVGNVSNQKLANNAVTTVGQALQGKVAHNPKLYRCSVYHIKGLK